MSWLLLAFLGGIASNISSFFSRIILKDDGGDSTLYAWFFEAVRFCIFLVVALFDFHAVWTFYSVLLLFLMGVSEFVSIFFYMKMHRYSHLSISTVLSRTRLVWIPLIALVLIGEHLKVITYIGILVLFVGLAIATAPHKLQFDRGQKYAYLAAFLIALNAVQMKMNQPFATPAVLIVFLTAPTTFVYPLLVKDRKKRFGRFFKHKLSAKFFGGVSSVAAIYFFTLALRTGPVSIVNAIYQGTMILSVLAGIFLLGEKEDTKRKIIGSIVTMIGVLLLS
ncbi:MAG: EamA family transporter [Patescibacteria group bacterium]|nr:EamA family transporter [Patescibacteria group bacterium]MDE2588843.1 EamA family transporter [Patescibacteria group bacterium]